MTASVFLQSGDLLPEAFNISFKLVPAIMVAGMSAPFLATGYVSRVADTEGTWIVDRSVGDTENGMVIGANWMPVASYLGLAGLVALSGFYGLVLIIGWAAGHFILLVFLAAQMRWFGEYTIPDFVGGRFNSGTAQAIGALMTILVRFVCSVGQARGMGLVGLYVFGTDYVAMVIVTMVITVGYLTISGTMGATKNMAVQYIILIIVFLTAVYVVGFTGDYSTVFPHIGYSQLIGEPSTEFLEPFANAGSYLWIAMAFPLIFGTYGLPHVLVRSYTVENGKMAWQSTVWELFFILLLYWSALALTAFGVDFYDASQYDPTFVANSDMSGGEGNLIVVPTVQLSNLSTWLVGLVTAGGITAAIATTVGLSITASSTVSHDIYTDIISPDVTQCRQVFVGCATIAALGIIVMVAAFDSPMLVGKLTALVFSPATIVLFPMFFLGLWWGNTDRQGALAGMNVGLTLWIAAMVSDLIFHFSDLFVEFVPAIGTALIGTSLVFVVAITVSIATDEPLERIKKVVWQCHSPEPMGRQQSAEDVIMSADGGQSPVDD